MYVSLKKPYESSTATLEKERFYANHINLKAIYHAQGRNVFPLDCCWLYS